MKPLILSIPLVVMATATSSAQPRCTLIDGANELVGVDLRPAKSEQELVRMLRDHAATLPKGERILGGYWDHEAWPSRALPTRQLIDAAKDLFTVAPREILNTRPALTMVGGRIVFKAAASLAR